MSPDVKINNDQIQQVLQQEVLKREVVEGEKADEARKKISRAVNRQLRARTEKTAGGDVEIPAVPPVATPPSTSPAAAAQTAPGA